ncbi:hypothetical protein GBA52_005432 [Prunus armeniaca]|nr:hypothetical protein GBA52_005432 [Prunus armeniaca]
MFSISQPNLLANKRKKFILSSHVLRESNNSVNFQWAPFPVEMTGVSVMVPSPSGAKLLVVRDPEKESPCQFEIWGRAQVEKEFHIPQSVHGSVYADGWRVQTFNEYRFQGISWNSDETLIAYVAEEPCPSKPTFTGQGYKNSTSADKDFGNWTGQGDWKEEWGETYAGKQQAALFVMNINSGETQAVKGIEKSLSVGQVVWAPPVRGSHQYLVFVGWSEGTRKLGIKYCFNRPCALYAVRAPNFESKADGPELKDSSTEDSPVVNLTQSITSALYPHPDGKFLLFLSARSAVDSGVHSATDSLHIIDWPMDGVLSSSTKIVGVIPVVMCGEDGYFPGLYCSSFLSNPWLSDGCTMILSSVWGSCQVILSVNVLSGEVLRISPTDSNFSWNVLTLQGDNIIAVSSSPVDVPHIKYGYLVDKDSKDTAWSWLNVSRPTNACSEKVSYGSPFSVHSNFLIRVRAPNFQLKHLIGSLGFGEEALQSLPGNIGSQDVNDVLVAIDHVIDMGLASPSKIAVLGGSHGGFLTTHLIGQASITYARLVDALEGDISYKFAAAATRNPACNLALMVGTTDIPDWCYVEAYGSEGKNTFTEAPSAEHLTLFHRKSPISHSSKVKTPTLFLLGAQDIRLPFFTGLQYARALKAKGVPVKVIVFPNDTHAERPQSDFESFLNIGVWFKKYLS